MEKRKVFKISIIDKEISRTEFDRNTFYTSDSELSLVFKLIERDYSYDHGEILLYNENDKSFVTRPINKKENDFVYELDLDIIPHYGKWKAQLRLVNDGDVYTSKPFEFVIENDLSNLAPQPTLTDINNWATLKQSANELIDEMEDVIVGVENAELGRVNKENFRQQAEVKRVNQESTRQNNELKRDNQEKGRQQAESQRESNEKKRRISEFERVDKEIKRQQAEQVRMSAELIRIENEEQRKIDHVNRSAELAGKADKVVLKNLIENGDFSDGLNGWSYYNLDAEIVNGKVKATITDTNVSPTSSYFGKSGINLYKNNEYYMRFEIEPTKETLTNIYINGNWAGGVRFPANELSIYSGVAVSNSTKVSNSPDIRINHRPDENYVIGDTYTLDNVVMIDLTKTFGAGNEPTKEEMDELIKVTGYIDGEYALNNKEMLIWTLALIRRNKNAIVALGGA